MLDLFAIFSKGGFVLWCFQGTSQSFTTSVNALIKSVILQERGGSDTFNYDALTMKYRLDNEFELVFVVAYQKFLQLSYVDKFLNDIQIEFRDKYKDDLRQGKICRDFTDFGGVFKKLLRDAELESQHEASKPKAMKTYQQSGKSQKTVASMIMRDDKEEKVGKKGSKADKNEKEKEKVVKSNGTTAVKPMASDSPAAGDRSYSMSNDVSVCSDTDALIEANRQKFFGRSKQGKTAVTPRKDEEVKKGKKGKMDRQWDNAGTDSKTLDYSNSQQGDDDVAVKLKHDELKVVGEMRGALKDIEPEGSSDDDDSESSFDPGAEKLTNGKASASGKKSVGFGFLSGLKSLVGSKTLTQADVEPVLEKMRHHLISKNVAAEIADNLCKSVGKKLEGKVLGTFSTVTSTVKAALTESCIQILTPRRRIDILRDAMEARDRGSPYVAVFCGVNGVGKSTNLAKICFWLIENGFRVLIAACDTFRAGAVEQLRTHCKKLNTLHPEAEDGRKMVQLYERGYGKDAAGIASEAIGYARDQHFDVVLVDTAGRMQDNAPLMQALAKLIKVNQPDLVLFVGEALVGNEAVDQLVKFNQALADHSAADAKPHLIDGIVLTKFDTIDDQVGAAISMTYITGQPIVFVGTGQTYTDLKNLNAKSVVHALLKP